MNTYGQACISAAIWAATVCLAWLPGILLARLFRLKSLFDIPTRIAFEIGLGVAFWPMVLLWTSTCGWHWTPTTARIFVRAICVASLLALMWVPKTRWRSRLESVHRSAGWLVVLAIILALTVWTRLLHVRDLVLPAWVDSVHHTAIVRLLLQHGALPTTYAPFISEGRFFYHWGYHAFVFWLTSLLGWTDPLDVTQVILQSGQCLNALNVLALYAAGCCLFRSRTVGALSATLATLVSWFPAYFVSWGRYTHLTGSLLLPIFICSSWRLCQSDWWGDMLTTIVLGAGLLLIHIRIAFFAFTFVIALLFVWTCRRRWRILVQWSLAGTVVVLLTLPWLLQLLAYERFRPQLMAPRQESGWWMSGYNSIQESILWAPHNRELFTVATGGLTGILGWGNMHSSGRFLSGIGMLFLFFLLTRHGHGTFPLRPVGVLVIWCGLTAFLLNLDLLGLKPIYIVHNNSALMSVYVPVSLVASSLVVWAKGQVVPPRFASWSTAVLLLGTSIWGACKMKSIVNPVTVLASQEDIEAMHWIEANVSPDACFAVNVQHWMEQTYAGTDGGYWIPSLTDRCSILPPALYSSALSPYELITANHLLNIWAQANALQGPDLYSLLREEKVSHIYIGAKGGHIEVAKLLNSPFVDLVYQNGKVFIFELRK